MKPRQYRDLESLIKINKHLGIALTEITKVHPYVGNLREQRTLISAKLKIEGIIERTLKAENLAKSDFFRTLKR